MTTVTDGSGPTRPTTPPPPPRPPRPNPPSREQLPTLGMVVRDAERLLQQVLAVLARDVDPASVPSDSGEFDGPGYVLSRILCARADVRSALKMLGDITDARLPAVGSAVPVRPPAAGEGRTSGLANAEVPVSALCESPAVVVDRGADASFSTPAQPPLPSFACTCAICKPRVSG